MATIIKTSKERIAEMESEIQNAFQELMTLVADANRQKAITLWVDGTLNSQWLGWEKGYNAAKDN